MNITYFLGDRDGTSIKIGRTTQKMAARMAQHAGRGPNREQNQLIFLAAVPGMPSDEKAVHSYFASLRFNNEPEWFHPKDELTGYVRWLRMQWFTIRTMEEADGGVVFRSHEGVDSSMWLPTPERIDTTDQMTLLSVSDGPWSEILDMLPPVTGDDFYTDERIIKAAKVAMGGIDLDPATHPVANRQFIRAPKIFTLTTNGLQQAWHGRVWCNPPFGQWRDWTHKVIAELDAGRVESVCVLLATRSLTTKAITELYQRMDAMCITRGRIPFWGPKATSSPDDGHAIFYFGPNVARFAAEFASIGQVLVRADDIAKGLPQ